MSQENIKKYVTQHKDNYPKELIIKTLIDAGYKLEDINNVYYNFSLKNNLRKNNTSQSFIIFKIISLIFIITYIMFYIFSHLSTL
jgi:hypothetical protein